MFTSEEHHVEINYLDLMLSGSGQDKTVTVCLYRKPTSKNALLHAPGCHPLIPSGLSNEGNLFEPEVVALAWPIVTGRQPHWNMLDICVGWI